MRKNNNDHQYEMINKNNTRKFDSNHDYQDQLQQHTTMEEYTYNNYDHNNSIMIPKLATTTSGNLRKTPKTSNYDEILGLTASA